MNTRTKITRHITFAALLAGLSGCSTSHSTTTTDAEPDVRVADAQADRELVDRALPDSGAPTDCQACRCDFVQPEPNETRPVCDPAAFCCVAIGPLPPPNCMV